VQMFEDSFNKRKLWLSTFPVLFFLVILLVYLIFGHSVTLAVTSGKQTINLNEMFFFTRSNSSRVGKILMAAAPLAPPNIELRLDREL
jgi:hypothetical protein